MTRVIGTTNEFEPGIDDREALDRGQDRNGWRDHRIAEEEGGTDHAKNKDEATPGPERLLGEHDEGEDSAFALVVGAHQNQDVFDRHDEDESPDQQGHDAEHILMHVAAGTPHVGESFAHRVKRAMCRCRRRPRQCWRKPTSACDGIPCATPRHRQAAIGFHSCFGPGRFTAPLLHRYDGAAFSRKTCNRQGLGRLRRLHIGLRRPPGRLAEPIGELFAAARAIIGTWRPLILAAVILALDANVEMIVMPIIGAHFGKPRPIAGGPAAQFFLDRRVDEDTGDFRVGRGALDEARMRLASIL